MRENNIRFIFKFTIVLAIILITLSFIVPLANLSIEDSKENIDIGNFYNWGLRFNIQTTQQMPEDFSSIISYFSLIFDDTYRELIGEGEGITIFDFFLFILLPITIFSIIYLIFAFKEVSENDKLGKERTSLLFSGICLSIVLLLFYLVYEFGLPNTVIDIGTYSTSITTINFNLRGGYYLLILSTITIFSLLIISSYNYPSIDFNKDLDSDEKLFARLKTRYVDGEITKEKYEEIKKELEEDK